MAARQLQHERNDHTLQPTALVNEAFLRLADQSQVNWQGRAHFCAIAAKMMRRVLVDHARRKAASKRERHAVHITFDETLHAAVSNHPVDIIALDDLMERLTVLNPRHARVFELRCFGGLDVRETAQVLDVSEATVKNDWRFARAWLASQLAAEQDGVLTEEQSSQFKEIIERRHPRMLDVRRKGANEMLAEFQAMEDEVAEVLDPKQRESWRKIAESVRNRFIAVSP